MKGQEKTADPDWLNQEQQKWRRFELITSDKVKIEELNRLLDRAGLSRRELAIILMSLRVRPEFSLKDFGT